MDDQKFAELKKKYGEVYEIEYGENKFYFRKPSRAEYKRYYDKLLESSYDALTIIVIDTVLIPNREEIVRLIEQDPTLPTKIGPRLTDFFGSQVLRVQKI